MIGAKTQSGFSLLEMTVTTAIFSVVVLMTTSIFQSINEGQRSVIAGQNTQESMRYAMEVISKEIRTAQKKDPQCGGVTNKKVFNTDAASTTLYFLNKNNECVTYHLAGNRFSIIRNNGTAVEFPITPDEVIVSDLKFAVYDDALGSFHEQQPYVTITMKVQMDTISEMHKNEINLQTTVSSRHYE